VEFVVFIGHFGKRNRHGHTASDLIWTQCALFRRRAARQREPLCYPAKSSSFAFLPCSSRLCQVQDGQFGLKNCSEDNRCVYGSAPRPAACSRPSPRPSPSSAAGSSPPIATSARPAPWASARARWLRHRSSPYRNSHTASRR
jgi:hypothetical protein